MSKCYASELLKVANAEVGYCEKKTNASLDSKTANAGYNNYTKYADEIDSKHPTFYNGKKNGYAWCDVFVDWCFIKAFGEANARALTGQPVKSLGAGCQFSANYYKQMGRFYNSPKAGDQIFFKDGSGTPCHTGLVTTVTGGKVYTIEGNTSSASGVVANGGCVAKKSYSLGYSKIYGYGRPRYDTEPVHTSSNKSSVIGKTGYITGEQVNVRNGAGTGYRVVTQLNKSKNHRVKIKAVCGDWYKVSFTLHGIPYLNKYIHKDYVKV